MGGDKVNLLSIWIINFPVCDLLKQTSEKLIHQIDHLLIDVQKSEVCSLFTFFASYFGIVGF